MYTYISEIVIIARWEGFDTYTWSCVYIKSIYQRVM